MFKTLAITRRELNTYFLSPLAYTAGAIFLIVTGIFFFLILSETELLTMRMSFQNMCIILLFATPVLTMRLMSEELKSGTVEPLMTAPVTETQVVLGKFIGALFFYVVMLLPTGAYAYCLSKLGSPDWGPIVTGYLGLLLAGMMFLSVGLFFSCTTKNQFIAGLGSFVFLLVTWVIAYAVPQGYESSPFFVAVKYLGIFDHFDSFIKGLIDTRDVIYFLLVTCVFLFFSVKVVESRKWR